MSEQVEIAILKTRMDEMDKNMNKRFDRLEDTLANFIEKADSKFSAKWVENAVKYVVVTIIGLVIVAGFKLLIDKPVTAYTPAVSSNISSSNVK